MIHLKDIEKYSGTTCDISTDTEYYRLFRHLFCRLMDVHEMFPNNEIPYLSYISEPVIDFLNDIDESGKCFKFITGNANSEYCKIEIYDGYETENIRLPKCILEDDWENKFNEYLKNKKHNDLVKQIEKLEESIKNGPVELERLKKELADMDNI